MPGRSLASRAPCTRRGKRPRRSCGSSRSCRSFPAIRRHGCSSAGSSWPRGSAITLGFATKKACNSRAARRMPRSSRNSSCRPRSVPAGEQPAKGRVTSEGWNLEDDRAESSSTAAPSSDQTIERSDVAFADVGGMEGVKEEIRMKILYPLKNPDLFKAYGKKSGWRSAALRTARLRQDAHQPRDGGRDRREFHFHRHSPDPRSLHRRE